MKIYPVEEQSYVDLQEMERTSGLTRKKFNEALEATGFNARRYRQWQRAKTATPLV